MAKQHEAAANPVTPSTSGTPLNSEGPRGRLQDPTKHSRVGALWTGLIVGAIILILLIIFIFQNLNKAPISFFSLHAEAPVGLCLLIAAIAGALIAGLIGSIRIWQIRRQMKKN